jgi:hypothetical protein
MRATTILPGSHAPFNSHKSSLLPPRAPSPLANPHILFTPSGYQTAHCATLIMPVNLSRSNPTSYERHCFFTSRRARSNDARQAQEATHPASHARHEESETSRVISAAEMPSSGTLVIIHSWNQIPLPRCQSPASRARLHPHRPPFSKLRYTASSAIVHRK